MDKNGLITRKNGVARVDGEIAVSRAIGDRLYKQFIISEPEVFHKKLEEDDELLVLSSDGLFLVYNEEQLAEQIFEMRQEGVSLKEIAQRITDESCMNFDCRDNISLILVDLKKHYIDNLAKEALLPVFESQMPADIPL